MSHFQEANRDGKVARVRRGFYIHLAVYVLVNAMLVGINFVTTPNRLWFHWPLFGWGIGILAHGIAAFALAGRRVARS